MKQGGSTRFRPFYAKEATRYDHSRYGTVYGRLFKALHHQSIRALLAGVPATAPTLELACGTGHLSELLAACGREFVACDLTPDMMARARERTAAGPGRAWFLEADVMRLPFPDRSFELVVATRLLHLFPATQQRRVLAEAVRVLAPGGHLLVDFDNRVSRWLYAVPYLLYNVVRYRRLAPYAVYNTAGQVRRMLAAEGLEVEAVVGVGGTHLVVPALLAPRAALALGRAHRDLPLRWLAEQLIVFARKR